MLYGLNESVKLGNVTLTPYVHINIFILSFDYTSLL